MHKTSSERWSLLQAGAKTKECRSEGCTNIVVIGGVCCRHGAKRKLCSNQGCTKQAKCVGDMGQRRNYAEAKGAPIKLKTEESALRMEQKSNDAAVKDAQIV